MAQNQLDEIFHQLGVKEWAKLGMAGASVPAAKISKEKAESIYRENRERIQGQLRSIAKQRGKRIQYLNLAFYAVISIMVISIIIQLIKGETSIIPFIQSACVLVLFPLASRVERRISIQAHIEFVAVFISDLEPSEALKAIEMLYQTISSSSSLKKELRPDRDITL